MIRLSVLRQLVVLVMGVGLLGACSNPQSAKKEAKAPSLDDSVEGMSGRWAITDYRRTGQGCDSEPSRAQFETGTFELGGPAKDAASNELIIRGCSVAAGCTEHVLNVRRFAKAEKFGWISELATARPTAHNTCEATLRRVRAVPTRDGVRVTAAAFVIEHATELNCVRREIIEAHAVEAKLAAQPASKADTP